MKGDEEKARAAGCDHYVTKPYSPLQLLRIIRGFLPEQAYFAKMSPVYGFRAITSKRARTHAS